MEYNKKLFDYQNFQIKTKDDLLKYINKVKDKVETVDMDSNPYDLCEKELETVLDVLNLSRILDLNMCKIAEDLTKEREFMRKFMEEYHTTSSVIDSDILKISTKLTFKNVYKSQTDIYYNTLTFCVRAAIRSLEEIEQKRIYQFIKPRVFYLIIRRVCDKRNGYCEIPDADNIGNEKIVNAIMNAVGLTDSYKVMWYCSGAIPVNKYEDEGMDIYLINENKVPGFLENYLKNNDKFYN